MGPQRRQHRGVPRLAFRERHRERGFDGLRHAAQVVGVDDHGPIQFALDDSCPGLPHTNLCLEFGTVPLPEMFEALRGDHWLHQHPEADAAQAQGIRQRLRAAFDPDGDDWRAEVWRQARQVFRQARDGLLQVELRPR